MTTVLDIIKSSLVTIKALAVGEAPGADMTTDALDKFNDVLETLSIQNLAVYQTVATVIPMVVNQASYTVGPGGIGQRPLSMNSIDSVMARYLGVDYEVQVVTQSEYDTLAVKQTTGIPAWMALNNDFPDATVSLFPVPYAPGTLTITQKQQFAAAAALADVVSMPQGYRRMLRLALAWELRNDYPGMGPQELEALRVDAVTAIANIKRANIEPVMLESEVSDLDASGGCYTDWRAGT